MKISFYSTSRKSLAFIASIVLFVAVFYNSSGFGLNWAIYTGVLSFLIYLTSDNQAHKALKVTCVLSILASFAVLWHGSQLSLLASAILLLVMAGQMADIRLSAWEGSIVAALNLLFSPVLSFVAFFKNLSVTKSDRPKLSLQWIIPGIVLFTFILLYYFASPIFKNILDNLGWPNIYQVLVLSLLGFFAASTLLLTASPKGLADFLYKKAEKPPIWIRNTHLISWKATIILLVALILVVISSDAYYRWVLNSLPTDLTLASYLHQGVFAVMVSALMAGFLGFYLASNEELSKDKVVHTGTRIFTSLNMVLILQTAMRNAAYIGQYGLTEKRVAVFIYLFMGIVALSLTLYGLHIKKRPVFLYRQLGISAAIVLVVSALVNWSIVITNYNLSNASKLNGIDYTYLLTLDEVNLTLLERHKFKMSYDERLVLDNRLFHYRSGVNPTLSIREFVIDDYVTAKQIIQSTPENQPNR